MADTFETEADVAAAASDHSDVETKFVDFHQRWLDAARADIPAAVISQVREQALANPARVNELGREGAQEVKAAAQTIATELQTIATIGLAPGVITREDSQKMFRVIEGQREYVVRTVFAATKKLLAEHGFPMAGWLVDGELECAVSAELGDDEEEAYSNVRVVLTDLADARYAYWVAQVRHEKAQAADLWD